MNRDFLSEQEQTTGKSLLFCIKLGLFSLLVAVACLFFCYAAVVYVLDTFFSTDSIRVSGAEHENVLLILDPGHGGEDGGASSGNILEKNLNLQISGRIYALSQLHGLSSVLTREDDRMLYDLYGDLTDYKGRKKTYDLRNRVRIAEEHPGAVFVSIHMNKFPKAQYSGLQVYYSRNNSESKALAELIRKYAIQYADPDNTREIKAATSSIYLMDRIQIPAVLVECGFLSNPEECEKLTTEEYQKMLSLAIYSAVADFLDSYINRG